ncbi:DUF475 domain-containing protein [Gordonia jinhuaensis]|uniref:Membrane protein n=1 Tax=Gordonia jinhuaensis TaxID=1517702 RepID=A0A916WRM3_9ACTN|nr:DUF475 domain-containing protein [Gordonia jinhuaensis]GGB23993.1 membrane protein [Gordonia jinhuaensis]
MALRVFASSIVVSLIALVVAFVYGGWEAVALAVILGVLEVSLSFDNAVINATILERLSDFWQRIFLTVGVVIAVFGMRLLFPLVIVWITSGLNPVEAFDLAMNPPANGADTFADGSPSYEKILTDAHPQIAAFGGMFLFMLFCDFLFTPREVTWLSWIERPLAAVGRLQQVPVVLSLITLVLVAEYLAPDLHRSTVLIAGILGIVTYLVVNGLASLFHTDRFAEGTSGDGSVVKATGRAAFFLFLYLEVLDASFSFDGVIGAFAITADPIIIALGLGFIGAMFVRSLTVYLVRAGTLSEYRYLEHGAHWAIGALAIILFITISHHINDVVTGLIGIAFIGAAFLSSVVANRRDRRRRGVAERRTQAQHSGIDGDSDGNSGASSEIGTSTDTGAAGESQSDR